MLPEESRDAATICLIFFFVFGFISLLFLLQNPSPSQIGMVFASNGYIYPTVEITGSLRLVVGGILMIPTLLCGFLGVYFIRLYLDYQKRS